MVKKTKSKEIKDDTVTLTPEDAAAIADILQQMDGEVRELKRNKYSYLRSYKSRKFILSILGGIIILVNNRIGLNLSYEEIAMIAGLFSSFIFVEGTRDAIEARNKN